MHDPIYVIGDIHGQIDELQRVLDLIEADGGKAAEVISLGDLVDRGPDSRAVIDLLMQGQAQGRNWTVLRGNHDRMFSRFVRGGVVHDAAILSGLTWTHPRLGGLDTLNSYGVDTSGAAPLSDLVQAARAAVPEAHLQFVEQNPLTVLHGELLFVHAGVRTGVPLDQQTEDDLIWIREPFLSDPTEHPWLVVHGHTALDEAQHFGNRIDLDGGAGYGRPLVAAVFEGRDCWLLTDQGRVPLLP